MKFTQHRVAGHPVRPTPTPPAPQLDGTDLPLVLHAEKIFEALGGAISLKTIRRMQRAQELPSFLLRNRRVTRREDLVATIAKLAKSA